MVEDQGIGYHGSEIHMPVLDQLAGERVKLENYYVQPICSPSCSQLMTGRYQIHTGLQHSIIHARQPLCLPPNIPTLPERLRQAGYSTHMVGKWHLGFCRPECLPMSCGFQSFLGSLTGSGDHFSFQSCDGTEACGFDLHYGEWPAWELSGNYSTRLYTERVKEILRGHDQWTPLFLYVALQAVHTPLQAPGHLLRNYQTLGHRPLRHYAAMDTENLIPATWTAKITSGLPCPRTEILFNTDPVSRKHGEADLRLLNLNGFGIWDTRVRAAIRAGDWKLLTGNVGDGDWFPPQTMPGGPQQWKGMEKRRDQRRKSVWIFTITADPYDRADFAYGPA
ncbi:hypothetical protein cypCar_00005163 [Cyprinus carpio]|nr:hypothetical protein cypCar_00005163 [Cyprinus carpio]